MGRLFDIEGPLMSTLTKVADLAILNLITIICCIPIFTIGASLTAMNYVLLKMVRKEEGYIIKSYFKSFRQNFKQATLVWIFMMVTIAIMLTDLKFVSAIEGSFRNIMLVLLLMMAIVFGIMAIYFFPVLSRYDNTIINSIKNALILAVINLPQTFSMIIITGGCIVLYYRYFYRVLPFVFLFGITAPAYINMILFSHIFRKLDEQSAQGNDQ